LSDNIFIEYIQSITEDNLEKEILRIINEEIDNENVLKKIIELIGDKYDKI